MTLTGGCQCGAVCYKVDEPLRAEFCLCGMCRKATGGVFAALATLPKARFRWTHGEPAFFASSNVARRAFCRDCGTPLTFEYHDGALMTVTIGSLDDPEIAGPNRMHVAAEYKLSWFPLCDGAPEHRLSDYADSPVYKPDYRSNQVSAG